MVAALDASSRDSEPGRLLDTVYALVRDAARHEASSIARRLGQLIQLLRTISGYEADIWTPRTAAGRSISWRRTGSRSLESRRVLVGSGTLPMATATRAVLAGSEAGAPRLYRGNDVRRFDPSPVPLERRGFTWTDKGPVADFWGDTPPSLPRRATPNSSVGGTECWRSVDGGTTFQKINGCSNTTTTQKCGCTPIPSIDFVPLAAGGERCSSARRPPNSRRRRRQRV